MESLHESEVSERDPSIENFLDTLDLPRDHRQFLKEQSMRPWVKHEINQIWHNLEGWGEGAMDRALGLLEDLINRINLSR